MQTLGGLSLAVLLALCYLLYFRSQPQNVDGSTDANAPAAVHASATPGVYKTDMDRAHAAAQAMQRSHADADDAGQN